MNQLNASAPGHGAAAALPADTRTMAVTSCSNSGYNLLTAWYDSTSVLYKESPNTMLFRMAHTGAGSTASVHSLVSLHPVPATSELYVDGAEAGAHYLISDAMGRKVAEGTLASGSESISLKVLSSGYYVLRISNNDEGSIHNLQFTKQ